MDDLWQGITRVDLTVSLRLPESRGCGTAPLRREEMRSQEHLLAALLQCTEVERALFLRTLLAKKLALLDEATWVELLTGASSLVEVQGSPMVALVHEGLETMVERFALEWRKRQVQDEERIDASRNQSL